MPKIGIDLKAKKEFFEALKKVRDNDLEAFFKDLMSSSEIKDLSRRFLAATFLKQGKTYQEISNSMGMSEGTINKVYFKTKGSRVFPNLL